jgi:hypothetical protein
MSSCTSKFHTIATYDIPIFDVSTFKNSWTYSITIDSKKKNPSSCIPSTTKICWHLTIVPFLTLKRHIKQRFNLKYIIKWYDQGKNEKICKKHLWTLKIYLKKSKHFILATFLHYTSYHYNFFVALVIVMLCATILMPTPIIVHTHKQNNNMILEMAH